MPIEQVELRGTEKDGSKSSEYCCYCYQKGVFLSPGMTLEQMTDVVKSQMKMRNIDGAIIALAVDSLPHLKRWNTKAS